MTAPSPFSRIIDGPFVPAVAAVFAAVSIVVAEPLDPQTDAEGTTAVAPPITSRPEPRNSSERAPNGNPLWGIPLAHLSATRERPLFSPSRRPPPPPPVAAPFAPPPPPPPPAEPEQPQLALVGTIGGEDTAFGIFLDQVSNTIVQLKLGEQRRGWTLRQIFGREAILQKDALTSVLVLPSPGGAKPTAPVAAAAQAADDPAGRRSRR